MMGGLKKPFTTDNGTANGYKVDENTQEIFGYNAGMRGKKGSEYDGGHRVPFIIRWPKGGLLGNKKLTGLTAHVDILPTLTALANIDHSPSKVMDGMDLSGYITDEEAPKDRYLVTDTQRVPWPVKGKQSCVMNGDWRLVNGTELYDVKQDPGQQNNLANQNVELVADMNAFYESWWNEVITETKYSVIDLGVDPLEVITCHDAHTVEAYPPGTSNRSDRESL